MATTKEHTGTSVGGYRVAFSDLETPGTYVSNKSGELFRIPSEALAAGRTPVMEIVGNSPRMLTKISDDPWIPISKARQLAAGSDLYVDF